MYTYSHMSDTNERKSKIKICCNCHRTLHVHSYHREQTPHAWIKWTWSFQPSTMGWLSTNLAEAELWEEVMRTKGSNTPFATWLQTGSLLSSQHPKLPFPPWQQSIADLTMNWEPGGIFKWMAKMGRKTRLASRMAAKEKIKCLWLGKKEASIKWKEYIFIYGHGRWRTA